MANFRDIKVWQKAHNLTLEVYKATLPFPKEEVYGLTNQLRRSCASIPANIAEGCGRGTDAELARFLHLALGSANELEYHLLLARDLALLDDSHYASLVHDAREVQGMLASFIHKLTAKS